MEMAIDKPNKSEIPTGSTTKENLAVDLISREKTLTVLDAEAWEYLDYIRKDIGGNMDCHISIFADNVRERIKELPSATPQSEWEHDHDVLKAHSDGVNEVLDKIRHEIALEARISQSKKETEGLDMALEIIDKYKAEGSDNECISKTT